MKIIALISVSALLFTISAHAQLEGITPEYLETLQGRSAKIIETLEIQSLEQQKRVQELIIAQYYQLSKIHDLRDLELEKAKCLEGEAKEQARNDALARCDAELYRLHAAYLAALDTELKPEQIEKVKDGMTYGVLDRTYQGYLKLLPELTDEQKRYIKKNLLEARELAMDAGSSEEKHGFFGKYKGRINNYLSSEGYDLKAAEKRQNNPSTPKQ